MVSSKTGAELERYSRELGLSSPFISENGGAILFPGDWRHEIPDGTVLAEKWRKWLLGESREMLVRALREIRDELNYPIKSFSEMSLSEISHLTGLDAANVELAIMREFDEPFILEEDRPDITELIAAAQQRGLTISTGGRFYHIHGKNDKGDAIEKLTSLYKKSYGKTYTIALGDSPNDFSMLKRVDQPVLIKSQKLFPDILKKIPGLMITEKPGPAGWNDAILKIVSNKTKGEIF
jgi:mannosyl-3-phosphoglycerate phosphatase